MLWAQYLRGVCGRPIQQANHKAQP
jgi:hypothetical protein